MPGRSLVVALAVVVTVLALCVVLFVRAASQVRPPDRSVERCACPPPPKVPPPNRIIVDVRTRQSDGSTSTVGGHALDDIRDEILRIEERLAAAIKVRRASDGGANTGVLEGIQDEIAKIAELFGSTRDAPVALAQLLVDIRAALDAINNRVINADELDLNVKHGDINVKPLSLKLNFGDLNVKHSLESVNDDLLAKIREIMVAVLARTDSNTDDAELDGDGGCRIVQLDPVTGFAKRKHALPEPGCARVAEDFFRRIEGNRVGHLILVGRADRMPFPSLRYGGNRGLAQARAGWLRDCLQRELPAGAAARLADVFENRTMLLSAGPLHVPPCRGDPGCNSEQRRRDRRVDMFACLQAAPQPNCASDSPTPRAVESATPSRRTGFVVEELPTVCHVERLGRTSINLEGEPT